MRVAISTLLCLSLGASSACSGGMSEVASGDGAVEPQTTNDQASTLSAATGSTDDTGADRYEAELAAAVLERWVAPNRDSRTPPRIGIVTVYLGPQGRVVRWTWRRRSPDGFFNSETETYFDRVIDSPRRFDLPAAGSPLRRRVLRDGVAVEVADDDA